MRQIYNFLPRTEPQKQKNRTNLLYKLSFSPQIKKFLLIEKKFLFKNPLFATKNAVFRRNVKKISFSSKIFVFFFEISLYLYIRNSN